MQCQKYTPQKYGIQFLSLKKYTLLVLYKEENGGVRFLAFDLFSSLGL